MVMCHGIRVKKEYGQHFLHDESVVHAMIDRVDLDKSSVCEIGCGDGFLTRAILEASCSRLWVFEIDPEWALYVRNQIKDERLHIFTEDVLQADWSRLQPHAPWILLANLPYQVTFPILYAVQKNRSLFQEGVVMVQEEVAQKIVQKRGRGFGYTSLFLQYYFDWELLVKVPPTAFDPPPSVYSRLLYFKPKQTVAPIERESEFWSFIKLCFKSPRRTLLNNLVQAHWDLNSIPAHYLPLRAQQMTIDDFLHIWSVLKNV